MHTQTLSISPLQSGATRFVALKSVGLLLALVLMYVGNVSIVLAQDDEKAEKPKLAVSGSVDAYFRANLNAPNDENAIAPVTSFANTPGFSLGMANIVASMEHKNVGFVADFVFGPRGRDAVFGSFGNGSSEIINQLYVYWNASEAVKFTIGNFNTFLGYEVISPVSNFNYSTSYMFSYGPFSHTGLKADFALSENLSAMVGVMNPTDMTEYDPFGTYTLGAQLGYSADKGSAYLNFLYGDQDGKLKEKTAVVNQTSAGSLFQVDLTTGWNLSEKWFAGLNATYNSTALGEIYTGSTIEKIDGDAAGFMGTALYLQHTMSDAASVGVRAEYFSEFNDGYGIIGAYEDGKASITAVTLSGSFSVGDLRFIPELRVDNASGDVFINPELEQISNLSSFVLGAVYSF